MQTFNQNIDLMHDHPRHAFDLIAQLASKRFHSVCNLMPVGEYELG